MAAKDLTKRELEILMFVWEKIEENGFAPTVREICKGVNLASTSSVYIYLKKLQDKGYVDQDPAKPRTLKIINYDFLPDSIKHDHGNESFSKRLLQLREEKHLSRKELSKKTGISEQMLESYEGSKTTPNIYNLAALSDALGVSVDYLVKGKHA